MPPCQTLAIMGWTCPTSQLAKKEALFIYAPVAIIDPRWTVARRCSGATLVCSSILSPYGAADPQWQCVISSSQGFSAWMPARKASPPGAETAASGCGILTSNRSLSSISGKQTKDTKVMCETVCLVFSPEYTKQGCGAEHVRIFWPAAKVQKQE